MLFGDYFLSRGTNSRWQSLSIVHTSPESDASYVCCCFFTTDISAIFTANEFTGFKSRYLARRVFIPWNILTGHTCKLQNVSVSLSQWITVYPALAPSFTVSGLAWRLAILITVLSCSWKVCNNAMIDFLLLGPVMTNIGDVLCGLWRNNIVVGGGMRHVSGPRRFVFSATSLLRIGKAQAFAVALEIRVIFRFLNVFFSSQAHELKTSPIMIILFKKTPQIERDLARSRNSKKIARKQVKPPAITVTQICAMPRPM